MSRYFLLSRGLANIGLPSRVKKVILPQEPLDEENGDTSLNNTMDSFKPLDSKCMYILSLMHV